MAQYLIVNADDFGYAHGVNAGIIAAHDHGIVLSTSLMVDMPLAREAARLAAAHPSLGVGLHFTVTDTKGAKVDLEDVVAIEKEFQRQYQLCCDLLGHLPTHIDSHHHVHLRQELFPLFATWAAERQVQLRGHGSVSYNGGFYGQWYDEDWRSHPAPELIGIENLEKIIRELPIGATELACHPAYLSPDLESSYAAEREIELTTLLHPRVPSLICDLGITLVNFATLPTLMEAKNVAA